MKRCPDCKQEKADAAFGINRARRDGLQAQCRACKKGLQSDWYVKNKEVHSANALQRKHAAADEVAEKLVAYLSEHPCIDCGETDPLVLDFDHVKGTKSYTIGSRVAVGYTWSGISKEIEKCEVRCSNCHRRKTARQLGYRRAILLGLCGGG